MVKFVGLVIPKIRKACKGKKNYLPILDYWWFMEVNTDIPLFQERSESSDLKDTLFFK